MLKKILKSYDYSIVIVYILLCLFGLVMIYSASMVVAVQRYNFESNYFYVKQVKSLILSFIAFFITAFLPYKMYKSNKFLGLMMLVSIIGLAGIFVFGHVSNNAQSWFRLGTSSIQPSEFVKLSVIIYLSAVYAKKQSYIDQFNKGVIPPLLFLIFVCFLIAIQPDLGTASIIFAIGLTIILCSGMKLKTMMKLFGLGLLVVLILSPVIFLKKDQIFSETRIGRFTGFMDPFGTKAGEGFQLYNSYLALGTGGIKGLGLGQSVQKLGYLPEPHTDFIMAIIAEELGIFGVAFVLLGLSYLVLRGIYIGVKCRDPFGSLLSIGISSMVGIQAFINLGGVSGIIPITGVPLPLISYGGSSLLLLSASLGVLVNVSMFVKYEEKYKKKQEHTTMQKTSINHRGFKVH
ncbi:MULTISPECIES: FtsW/RodA/SpoVE family cell cycle protein [Heyndrickxia]|uniref:Probable peptidoglycan glycosyltransferase FtsW n=1 Tax=Heyndrickxia oleronia TaxID=38875 RepID=A0A8E2I8H8_9BACI|nr:FtsW/RodA/SpoVE family cell cycle protein [Heyndrickxia oleronia]NYV67505.1 FtsW/RodA/SpoVE family cell cycle protein [Bacillus sp. Gen3]MCI1589761.1 FtsW/RodA/SpoVE family cell cycle protein [Heyndrickxia oleronia]MCI1611492.1 FtsW/RodA/SpoVE family cell cycle protein [Heyndrickxia oleronia]MCI1742934.1 FtsW/RodA/SpoVE family cell cycle protein [Heyndrickxia oleronia]MCI1760014.1 FtsW/RodA/SpoVE family cell cycle protein [Heyndrickxia oleronia]